MIVKFLGNKKGGSSKSIDYLLNKERVAEGTARILSGDENQTREIINSLTKKQKVTFGVLSFEEDDIPASEKKELMAEFEKTFLAGLEHEQYNILWVQHTDKGRLELNCIIPKVELSTGRSLNPYYHGSDFHLADLFQKRANLKYGYSDPKDPSKSQSLQGEYKKTGVMKDYVALDKLLHKMVAENTITSRAELVEFIKDNGIEVPREGKDYISVKLDSKHKAKRLKGGIYAEQFKGIAELRTISKEQEAREREYASRDTRAELKAVEERFSKAVKKRSEFNKEIYSKPKQTIRIQDISLDSSTLDINRSRSNTPILQEQISSRSEELDTRISRGQNTILHREGGKLDDRIRESFTRRAREREAIFEAISGSHRQYREKLLEKAAGDSKQLYSEAHRVVSGRAERRRTREYISRAIKELGDKIISFGEHLKEQFRSAIRESGNTTRTTTQLVERKEQMKSNSPRPRGMTF